MTDELKEEAAVKKKKRLRVPVCDFTVTDPIVGMWLGPVAMSRPINESWGSVKVDYTPFDKSDKNSLVFGLVLNALRDGGVVYARDSFADFLPGAEPYTDGWLKYVKGA